MPDIRSLAFTPTPEQMTRLAEQADTGRRMAAHAATFHDGAEFTRCHTSELVFEPWMASHPQFKHVPRPHGSDPRFRHLLGPPDRRLEDTILSDPPRSVVSEAAAILDRLSDGLNPSDREAADAALALTILTRCEALAAAARARLQS